MDTAINVLIPALSVGGPCDLPNLKNGTGARVRDWNSLQSFGAISLDSVSVIDDAMIILL